MVGKFVEYPFDTVKLRLQTQPLDRPYYAGPMDCFLTMLKNEGASSFYKVRIQNNHIYILLLTFDLI